jgi:hypothetical protein
MDFETLTANEGGKRKRMPSIEIQYKTMFNNAMKGDLNAARDAIKLMKDYKASLPPQSQKIVFKVVPDELLHRRSK